jgi:hypothetical protein
MAVEVKLTILPEVASLKNLFKTEQRERRVGHRREDVTKETQENEI